MKMSRSTYLCVAPSIDTIAVTTVPKLAFCIETSQIYVPRPFLQFPWHLLAPPTSLSQEL